MEKYKVVKTIYGKVEISERIDVAKNETLLASFKTRSEAFLFAVSFKLGEYEAKQQWTLA